MIYCEVLSKRVEGGKSTYVLRLENGSQTSIDGDKLKEKVASREISLLNMKLTSDKKLITFDYGKIIEKVKKDIEKLVMEQLKRNKCRLPLVWGGNNYSGYTLILQVVRSPKDSSINPAIVTFKVMNANRVDMLCRRGTAVISAYKIKTDKDIATMLDISVEDALDYINNV